MSTPESERNAYSLLLAKGLIRVFIPLPLDQLNTNPPMPTDYEITGVRDPYGCTDLSANKPMVSIYRRPLPSANLRFLTQCPPGVSSCAPLAIMWDGRELSLNSQAKDATLIHAQAANAPTNNQIKQIVDFESQIYDAQVRDDSAGKLNAHKAYGGPVLLSKQDFYIGINDVLGGDPLNPGIFTPTVFTLYNAWENVDTSKRRNAARQAVARGQALFNTKQFTITGVNGLNLFPFDPLGTNAMTGTCTTCHDL